MAYADLHPIGVRQTAVTLADDYLKRAARISVTAALVRVRGLDSHDHNPQLAALFNRQMFLPVQPLHSVLVHANGLPVGEVLTLRYIDLHSISGCCQPLEPTTLR